MSHTDPEILALRALGETAGTDSDDMHTAACPVCRAELDRLTEVVAVARRSGAEELESPPPQVWERIAAAVGSDTPPPLAEPTAARGNGSASPLAAVSGPSAEPRTDAQPPGPGARRPARRRRGRLTAALAGLAAGLIIGIGAATGIAHLTSAPAARVVATVELQPLPQSPQWRAAAGTAVMRTSTTQRFIDVTLDAPRKPGFYEVWLLARDGVSMISLGDLSAAHTGTFTIPPGVNLGNYSRIDVSLQPFNGSTLHSRTSVVRGSLPPAATGAGT